VQLLWDFSHAGQPFFFSTLMSDEANPSRAVAEARSDLLDRLIEQYQYRLFRYLVYVTGAETRRRFLSRNLDPRPRRGHQYDGKSKFEAWLFAIARHLVIDWQRSKKAQSLDTLTDPEQEHPLQLANENEPSPLHRSSARKRNKTFRHLCGKFPQFIAKYLSCASRRNYKSTKWQACSAFHFPP